jgi:hypothetical protein
MAFLKTISLLLLAVILAGLAGAEISLAQEPPASFQAHELGIADQKLLPGHSFYWLKEGWRKLKLGLTFEAKNKAKLQLRYLNERVIELQKLAFDSPDPQVFKRALQNYQKHFQNFTKLMHFLDTQLLVDLSIKHLKILNNFPAESTSTISTTLDTTKKTIINSLKTALTLFSQDSEKQTRLLTKILISQKRTGTLEAGSQLILSQLENADRPDQPLEPVLSEDSFPLTPSQAQAARQTCPQEFAPVCGADGVTYVNPCLASLAGIKIFQFGACPLRIQ